MMNKKHLFLAFAASAILPFAFTACDDDDPTIPSEIVSSVTFTDTDLTEGTIGGTLSWTAPSKTKNIDSYNIYISDDGTTKGDKLGSSLKGETSFTVPAGTKLTSYFIVVTSNAEGEALTWANVQVKDAMRPINGYYVLNQGKYQSNNATLSYYDLGTKTLTADIFSAKNNRKLGDTANDFIVYGSKMYIAGYGSQTIEITDLRANSLKQIKPSSGELLPRSFAAAGGKVYVSLYDGNVARIDTASMSIEKTIKVGANPEQMAISNGKLYVANSGGMSYPTYNNTVSVIDLSSFTVTKTIKVVLNPVNMLTTSNGNVYLVSMGNYSTVQNTLQKIDPKTDAITTITTANGTEFGALNNTLYMLYSQYDSNWNQVISYVTYDAANDKVINNNFITDGTAISKSYKVGTIAGKSQIYVSTSDYKTNGTAYIFNTVGVKQLSFETGVNPCRIVYVGQ